MVVPLLVSEATSRSVQALYRSDAVVITWWATEIECTSALARREGFPVTALLP